MDIAAWKIWVDTGGTFTDCIARDPTGAYKRLKVLSSSLLRIKISAEGKHIIANFPFPISKHFLTGFGFQAGSEKRIIKQYDNVSGEVILNRPLVKTAHTSAEIFTGEEVPVFISRLLTETSLSEDFPPIEMKLGSTKGTNALLERKGEPTALLVTKGFRDLLLIGTQQRKELFSLSIVREHPLYDVVEEVNERIESDGSILRPLAQEEIDRVVKTLKRRKIYSVAVAFLNSYKNPTHEQLMGNALLGAGINYVSLSHCLSTQIRIIPRTETTLVNAYLEPVISRYISGIRRGLTSSSISIMSSAGGLLAAVDFKPKDSLLSGPAGGVIGALEKARLSGVHKILTFDMGGTSTDVSRCNGRPDYRFDCTVGNLKIFSPSLSIETIAAGGGSICHYDGYRFTVGPHSAGAAPGPACYGAGGPLTITDINLLLGRLDEENFSIPIKIEKAFDAFSQVLKSVRKQEKKTAREAILESFIQIANEKMAEAIRKVSIQQGHDPAEYALLCFGGAGGQHACALAALLGTTHIIVPYDAGLLSAFGIGHAMPERIKEKLYMQELGAGLSHLETDYQNLIEEAKGELILAKANSGSFTVRRLIFLRLKGQETSLEIEYTSVGGVKDAFINRYKKIYGHWLDHREIEIESIRIVVTASAEEKELIEATAKSYKPEAQKIKRIFTGGSWKKCPVFVWENLAAGAAIDGPALVISNNSTVWVEKGWRFQLDENQNAHVKQYHVYPSKTLQSDEAQLELFANRFTSIADEMGQLLQRSSFSVNVKERLDFSCTVLDANGNLVVNAPHIPVHLGSMGVCVRAVMSRLKMRDGDVIITNHPKFGGSHLPDITLIKPVFFRKKLVGFVANRAHHAEIGGTKPGSMPSDARCLEEEGVVIEPMFLIHRGIPQWNTVKGTFKNATYPTRSLDENIADLNGALAALILGEDGLQNLCLKFGAAQVTFYMNMIRNQAARLMSEKIKTLASSYRAIERLDDGTKLLVGITRKSNRLRIDFSGTSSVHKGNLNATQAIVHSVVLYVLRLLINKNVPLNEGLLKPVKIIIPKGLLNPEFSSDNTKSPAVVGGNTEISQRLTDLLLKAFKLAACSQGTMNNFLFGNERFGYYETICGGVGAIKGMDGADAVHQHMTNTRITDPEILEFRYPVRLEKFGIRKGSGGKGRWKGGDGVERHFYFKEGLDVNILSQHRIVAPYGMQGGGGGGTGSQYLIHANQKKIKIKGVDGVTVNAGDRLVINTPGGGGWGKLIK